MKRSVHDYLIAGGGISGLSLAAHLARALPGARVLVVERDPHDLDGRNLSYWSRAPTLFDSAARAEWAFLDVRTRSLDLRCALGEYRYRSLRGADFVARARTLLAATSVSLIEGEVVHVTDGDRQVGLEWDGGAAVGRWLFDGRRLPDDSRRYAGSALVRQRFLGWEIETAEDRFDPAAATFLDFRVDQRDAVAFFYVLPFTARHALVELVMLDGRPSEELLREHLAHAYGVTEFNLLAVESGASPLTDRRHPRRLGRRIMAIGVHGGRLKASTGYAFARIQRDSQSIARSLMRHGHPFAVPRERRRFRWLDSLLLRVMQSRPEAVAPAFEAMFRRNPLPDILRFLDEDASWCETLRIALRLPPGAFVAELAQRTSRRRLPRP